MTTGNDEVDRRAAELSLLDLVGEGRIERIGLGDDAVWIEPAQADTLRAVIAAAWSNASHPVGF
jgi:hypothetical protein